MGERQPRRQKAEFFEPRGEAFAIVRVSERALIAGLEEMHVDAPAGSRGGVGNAAEQFVRTPLRAVGAELHSESRTLDGRGDCFDARDLLLRGWLRRAEARVKSGSRGFRQAVERRLGGAVNEGIAIAHEHGERYAHADFARGAGEDAGLADGIIGRVKARVVRHHRAGAAARGAAERGERAEIGIDRRHRRQSDQPKFQGLVGARRTKSATARGNDRVR